MKLCDCSRDKIEVSLYSLSMYYILHQHKREGKCCLCLVIIAMPDSNSFVFISAIILHIWYGLNSSRPLDFNSDVLNRNPIAHSCLNSTFRERKEKYQTFPNSFAVFALLPVKLGMSLMFAAINYHIVAHGHWSERSRDSPP